MAPLRVQKIKTVFLKLFCYVAAFNLTKNWPYDVDLFSHQNRTNISFLSYILKRNCCTQIFYVPLATCGLSLLGVRDSQFKKHCGWKLLVLRLMTVRCPFARVYVPEIYRADDTVRHLQDPNCASAEAIGPSIAWLRFGEKFMEKTVDDEPCSCSFVGDEIRAFPFRQRLRTNGTPNGIAWILLRTKKNNNSGKYVFLLPFELFGFFQFFRNPVHVESCTRGHKHGDTLGAACICVRARPKERRGDASSVHTRIRWTGDDGGRGLVRGSRARMWLKCCQNVCAVCCAAAVGTRSSGRDRSRQREKWSKEENIFIH